MSKCELCETEERMIDIDWTYRLMLLNGNELCICKRIGTSQFFRRTPPIKINYCPHCGRKLEVKK